MTLLPSTEPLRRVTPLRITVVVGLLFISGAVVIHHVALSDLAGRLEANTPGMQLAALEARLAELTRQVEANSQQPAALPQARYESERLVLHQRLAAIEQALEERLSAGDLLPLQARVAQLEARLATRPTSPTASHPPAPVSARPAEPPFAVIGTELRAGERFLSILPAGPAALSQVRVLRPGEEAAGWRLEVIEGGTAVFRHGDALRRLAVPAR